jgi:hypothetical protein
MSCFEIREVWPHISHAPGVSGKPDFGAVGVVVSPQGPAVGLDGGLTYGRVGPQPFHGEFF